MHSKSKRVHIMLNDQCADDLAEIRQHIRKNGSSGGLSEAIRFALRKTADNLESRSR